ncbi:ABC transporter substrate-binding protein [Streptomyces aidingensis]|uniref:Multiple sugar transport system substrate-binding protein n=1 Tax=Streptomyces aidingensis TaxID=910347 RepID=A0A1I1M6F4_9ACTN|nr:sugar ABC transporter substrate-binding protein [Streptomyces aidingensis]SFC80999.1 multiple sugar transport system substrate-binding protein [Streptomyces aidingensis]
MSLRMSPYSSRRSRVWPALLVTGALAFTAACGGDDDGGSGGSADGGQTTIEFSWWGSDERHQLTQQAVDAFEAKNPGIKVEVQFSDWDSFYDTLTTQVASGDAPDVFTIEIRRLGEFARAGRLADAGSMVATEGLNSQLLTSGQVDGTQYAIPTGANTFALMANTKILADAGVELPDDSSWTWEDYHALAAQVSEATGEDVYGTQINFNDAYLRLFAAQRGEEFYEGTQIGISPETIADWFQTHLDLIGNGGSPDAALSTEVGATSVEQSLIATNTGAMGMWWSNQLGALTTGSGEDVQLLQVPKEEGATTNGMFLQPTMFWAISEQSDKQEAAAKLVDFLVNDPEAGAILGSDRGLPMNDAVLSEIRDELPAADQQSLAFIEEHADSLTAPTAYPNGAGDVPDMLQRYGEEVIFERMTPEQAAEEFLREANGVLS